VCWIYATTFDRKAKQYVAAPRPDPTHVDVVAIGGALQQRSQQPRRARTGWPRRPLVARTLTLEPGLQAAIRASAM